MLRKRGSFISFYISLIPILSLVLALTLNNISSHHPKNQLSLKTFYYITEEPLPKPGARK